MKAGAGRFFLISNFFTNGPALEKLQQEISPAYASKDNEKSVDGSGAGRIVVDVRLTLTRSLKPFR